MKNQTVCYLIGGRFFYKDLIGAIRLKRKPGV